jgi:hypothetical protein
MVAVRDSVVVLAGTLNETDPFPAPEAGLPKRTHPAVVDAAQSQLEVTVIVPLPPDVAIVRARVLKVVLQAAAACVTRRILLPIVTSPVRIRGAAFGRTCKLTPPSPGPDVGFESTIQFTVLTAVQLQDGSVYTSTALLSPSDRAEMS